MKLADWIMQRNYRLRDVQRWLNIPNQTTFMRYVRNERMPEPETMKRIKELTKGEVTEEDCRDKSPPKCAVVITLPNGKKRTVLPFSNRKKDLNASTKVKEEKQPSEYSPPLEEAILTLGKRLIIEPKDVFRVDGRLASTKRVVAMANRIRLQRGQPVIRYPGVCGGEVITYRDTDDDDPFPWGRQ